MMPTYHLFRAKLLTKTQPGLFANDIQKEDILIHVIKTKPSYDFGRNQVWHIGNVNDLNGSGVVFAIGRTTTRGKSLYDEEKGEFIELEDEESPYTYVFYIKHYSLMAIMYNSKVSPHIKTVANKITKIINSHAVFIYSPFELMLSEIWDPNKFIEYIRNAARVVSFSASASRPNPFDVNSDFHKPLEKLIEAADANKGETTVKGEDLNRTILEEIAHSVASTGDDARMRFQDEVGGSIITKHMRGDSVTVTTESDDKHIIVRKIIEKYEYIRQQKEDDSR